MALNIMEGFTPVTHDDAFTVHRQIESMKLAFADASAYIADPNHLTANVGDLLNKKYAAKRRALIEDTAVCPPPGEPYGGHTVYLCAADGDGNMVSLIQSIAGGWGSAVVIPGTGILMQNRGTGFSMDQKHPNCVSPRKRAYHTIIPGFITKGGIPVGPFGVMGGKMQPQGHMQVLMNMIDFGMNPQAALDAPRWFWQKDLTVWMENSWANVVTESLAKRGHKIEPGAFYGRGQIIIRLEDGVLCGGTEPRGGGSAMAF
jgi:gamma-glutamyltranspeptidase/glutathione hydrolase